MGRPKTLPLALGQMGNQACCSGPSDVPVQALQVFEPGGLPQFPACRWWMYIDEQANSYPGAWGSGATLEARGSDTPFSRKRDCPLWPEPRNVAPSAHGLGVSGLCLSPIGILCELLTRAGPSEPHRTRWWGPAGHGESGSPGGTECVHSRRGAPGGSAWPVLSC